MKYEPIVNELYEKYIGNAGRTVDKSFLSDMVEEVLNTVGSKLNKTVAEIQNTADKTHSLKAALDEAALSLGHALMLFDRDISLVAYSNSVKVTDPVWKDTIERGYCSFELRKVVMGLPHMRDLETTDATVLTDNTSSRSRIVGNINLDNRKIGYLLMIAEEGEKLRQVDMMAFQSAIDGITYAISRYGRYYFWALKEDDHVLKQLLSCLNSEDVEAVLKNAGRLPDYKSIRILCIKSDAQNKDVEAIRIQIQQILPESVLTMHNDSVVVLTFSPKNDPLDTEQIAKLRDYAALIGAGIGISNTFYDLKELLPFYRQATRAVQLCREGVCGVIEYETILIRDLVEMSKRIDATFSYSHPAIELLCKIDEEKHTDFAKTLQVYVENYGNIRKSAEGLYIHRNTMIQRMNRIVEITGLDLGDHDTMFYLQLSYRMKNSDL